MAVSKSAGNDSGGSSGSAPAVAGTVEAPGGVLARVEHAEERALIGGDTTDINPVTELVLQKIVAEIQASSSTLANFTPEERQILNSIDVDLTGATSIDQAITQAASSTGSDLTDLTGGLAAPGSAASGLDGRFRWVQRLRDGGPAFAAPSVARAPSPFFSATVYTMTTDGEAIIQNGGALFRGQALQGGSLIIVPIGENGTNGQPTIRGIGIFTRQ